MAAAAAIGGKYHPVQGYATPIANGIATVLYAKAQNKF